MEILSYGVVNIKILTSEGRVEAVHAGIARFCDVSARIPANLNLYLFIPCAMDCMSAQPNTFSPVLDGAITVMKAY